MIIIPVIGHARSGTSATAQLIERMGAATLPKTVRGEYNTDYQESATLNGLCCGIHPWHCLCDEKNTDPTIIRGIASYLGEHQAPILVIKCPAFPFMLTELLEAITQLSELIGDITVHKVFVSRNLGDVARSADRFTRNAFGYDHWHKNALEALNRMNYVARGNEWVTYELMVARPDDTIAKLLQRIPQLHEPEDHGIRPELNHAEERRNAAKAG